MAELGSLKDLVEPEALKTAMRFYHRRANEERTGRMLNEARLMVAIARHWVKVPPAALEELKAIAKACDPGVVGMTPKNQELLRRFEPRGGKRRLVDLPHRLVAKLKPGTPLTDRQAVRVQQALLVQLLLVAPMRLRNLVELELDRHLAAPSGPDGERLIVIPASEVKNAEPSDPPALALHRRPAPSLPRAGTPDAARRALTLPVPGPGRPGAQGGRDRPPSRSPRSPSRELGVRVSPHQFRHLAGKFILDVRPDAHELVRALLGHKRLETTLRYYARLDQERAARHYDGIIASLREPRCIAGVGRMGTFPHRPFGAERRCLPVSEWPSGDRRTWEAILQPAGFLERASPAAAWATATRRAVAKSYGRYLAWLARTGQLEPGAALPARLTPATLAAFVEHLLGLNVARTVITRLIHLDMLARAVAPERDWSFLRAWQRRLEPPGAGHQQEGRAAAARRRLRAARFRADGAGALRRGGPGLLAAGGALPRRADGRLLALRPLRLGNFTRLGLGRHLVRRDGAWWIHVPAGETKAAGRIDEPWPECLAGALDIYLLQVRPALIAHRPRAEPGDGDRSGWAAAAAGSPERSVFARVARRTKAAFGQP